MVGHNKAKTKYGIYTLQRLPANSAAQPKNKYEHTLNQTSQDDMGLNGGGWLQQPRQQLLDQRQTMTDPLEKRIENIQGQVYKHEFKQLNSIRVAYAKCVTNCAWFSKLKYLGQLQS